MHYEQYYQVATKEKFIASGVDEASLSTCRVLQQATTTYTDMRCCGDFTVEPGMLVRHLEFSNGDMQMMWASAIQASDNSLIPFKIEELNLILANEPQEV